MRSSRRPPKANSYDLTNSYHPIAKVFALLSPIIPYADPDLEMLRSYGRFLLPHLPLDRDPTIVKVGDEVVLQYYRLERVFSGAIEVKEGEPQ